MALNALGLGMTIKAKDAASAVFKRVEKSLGGLHRMTGKMSAGFGQMATGVRGMALGFLPFTAGLGLGLKAAADFEQQMGAVRSVLSDAEGNMGALSAKAKEVGLLTSKSAKEAADGLEALGRAGFSSKEAMTALLPVVNAAEADGMDLGRTAEIVSDSLNAMGQGADQAKRFADVLAFTSASTATNIEGLAEGMKFAAPMARRLGLSFEDLSLGLGFVANAGLKAGQGGTALKNMLLKLAKPSAKAKTIMKDLGLQFEDSKGNMVPFNDVVGQLMEKIPKMGGNMQQTAKLAELFGLRGQGAADAMVQSFTKLEKTGKLKELQQGIKDASKGIGKAAEMSKTRLKGLGGAITILKGTVETVAITAFEPFLPLLESIAKGVTSSFNEVGKAIGLVFNPSKEANAKLAEMNPTVVAVAKGFKDAFNTIKGAIESTMAFVSRIGNSLNGALGPDGVRALVKFATIAATIAAALAPVAIALVGIAFVMGPVIAFVKGLAAVAIAAFSPWGLAIAAVVGLLIMFRAKIFEFVSGVKSALLPFFDPIAKKLTAIWGKLSTAWTTFTNAFASGTGSVGDSAKDMGKDVGKSIGGFLLDAFTKVSEVASGFSKQMVVLKPVFKQVGASVMFLFNAVGNLVSEIFKAVGASGKGGTAFTTMGQVLATVVGAIAIGIGVVAAVFGTILRIVTPVIAGVVSLIGGIVTIVTSAITLVSALINGDWATVWSSAKTIVFEFAKSSLTIVGALVGAIAGAIDSIGKLFGKDIGAAKFAKGIQSSLTKNLEKTIKGQEQIAKERATARASAAPKPTAPTAAPAAPSNPAAAFTAAASAPAAASAQEIAAAMKGVTVQGNIAIKTEVKVNEAKLGEVVEKISKKLEAKRGR